MNTTQAFSEFVRCILSLKSLEAGGEAPLVEHNVDEYVKFYPMIGKPFKFEEKGYDDVVKKVCEDWEPQFNLMYTALDGEVHGAILGAMRSLANAQFRAEDLLIPEWVSFYWRKEDPAYSSRPGRIHGLTYSRWGREVFRAFTAPEFGQFRDTTITIKPPDADAFLTGDSEVWLPTMRP